MIRHALTIAIRNFLKHKHVFLINLIGLSTGLATALLIFLWVKDELAMNKFHDKNDRLYQAMEHQSYAEGIMTTISTPGLLAETLKEEIPEVEYAATIIWPDEYTLSVGEKVFKGTGHYAGVDFFHLFSFPLVKGDKSTAIARPGDIALSIKTADILFGGAEEAIGQSLEFNHDKAYTVTAIFEDVPENSSMEFDFLLPYEDYKAENDWLLQWGNNGPHTVLALKEGTDGMMASAKIKDFIKDRNENSNVELFLYPYSKRYLHGRFEDGKLVGGRIEYVRLFSIIAIFILIIACINFVNLATARASRRAKEVGVKKAVGADRKALVYQYLGESILIAFISLLLGLILVQIALPEFNLLTDKQLHLSWSPLLIFSFIGITLFTGLLAGIYPAAYLAGFKPVQVLKGEIRTSLGELWARRGLVVFQFTMSIILIISVLVVYRQIQFVQSQHLGYDKEQLLYFSMEGRVESQTDAFLSELKKVDGIQNASTISHTLIGRNNNTSGLNWEGKNPDDRILFENIGVNYDLIETIGVDFIDGRPFSREFGADSNKIIFNQTAIDIMGMEDPIGQKIRLWDQYDMEIIGVVKDFHFQSFREEMKPLFFRLKPEFTWNVMVRIEPGKEKQVVRSLEKLYSSFNPGFPLEVDFLDEEYALMYAAERRVASLSGYFAGFAILISCLGLFGLATFTTERKKKEIGIRKVLGASVMQIIVLLTKDFSKLVLVSLLIGLPLAYAVAANWLSDFAYKIHINIWLFVLSGALVMLISWLTVSSQAFRSAQVNPKECLKDE